MPYEIEFVREAKKDLRRFRKTDQVKVLDRIEMHLRHDPVHQSRSRIKRLRGDLFPPFRLRVDEFRVYYDVDETVNKVIIYGIVSKKDSEAWLAQSKVEGRKER